MNKKNNFNNSLKMYGSRRILQRLKLIEKVDEGIDNAFNWILEKRFKIPEIRSRGNKLPPRRMYLKKDDFLFQTYTNWKRFGVIQMELFKNPKQEELIKELDEYVNKRSEIIDRSIGIIKEYNLIYKNLSVFESEIFEVPETFLTAFQQYFLFFSEYLKTAKGIDVEFEVYKALNGIMFRFNANESLFIQIQEYLVEYIDFARKSEFSIIKVNGNPSANEIDFLRLRLEQQVNLLQTELKYKDLLINRLELDIRDLKKKDTEFTEKLFKSFENLNQKLIEQRNEDNNLQNDKDIFKQLLRNNKINELFSYLNFETTLNMGFENELIVLQNQFNELEKNKRLGTLAYEEELRSHNRIIMSLTQIIERL